MNTASRGKRAFWFAVFGVIFGVAVSVPLYNRVQPTLAGIPFFYWFQFGWIVVTAVVTALA